jgi:hypothetical protein
MIEARSSPARISGNPCNARKLTAVGMEIRA